MKKIAWIGLSLLLSLVTYCAVVGVYTETPYGRAALQMTKNNTGFQISYTNREAFTVFSDSDFSSYGFPGTGDENNPYRIEGYNITENSQLISIIDTESYFVIQDNYLNSIISSQDGIYIKNAKNGLVYNNTVVNNRHGIFIDKGCQGIDVVDNKIWDSSQSGIRVNSSTDVRINNNEVYQNTYNGIWANSSTQLVIWNNTIYNDELGIWLRNSNSSQIIGNLLFGNDNAMWISNQSNSNNITYNRIFDPADLNPNICGIHLSHNAHENNFLNNTVANSIEHGFYVEASSSSDNTIRWNTFIGNNVGGTSQAFDAASVNVLYNYWSDWTTPDANFDQIVDLPYVLEGAAMNEDPFPLTQPANITAFHFLTPITLLYPNGGESITDSVNVQWSAIYDSDNHEVNYSIYVSHNSGTDWEKIVGNLTTSQYEWNTISELKTTHYLIQVIAYCSDGLIVLDESDGEFSLIAHTLSEITITSPNSSGPFDTSLMIEWDAAVDSWGWIVSCSIQYSSTGGYSWNDLASGLTGNSYQWDISQLHEDDTYVVKIVASADGGVTTEAISVLFSIQHMVTTPTTPVGGGDMTLVLVGVGIAGVAVVIILVIFLRKKSAGET